MIVRITATYDGEVHIIYTDLEINENRNYETPKAFAGIIDKRTTRIIKKDLNIVKEYGTMEELITLSSNYRFVLYCDERDLVKYTEVVRSRVLETVEGTKEACRIFISVVSGT